MPSFFTVEKNLPQGENDTDLTFSASILGESRTIGGPGSFAMLVSLSVRIRDTIEQHIKKPMASIAVTIKRLVIRPRSMLIFYFSQKADFNGNEFTL